MFLVLAAHITCDLPISPPFRRPSSEESIGKIDGTKICLLSQVTNALKIQSYPIGSMYGIFTYIWFIFMVNVGKYTIIYHTWILWVLLMADIPNNHLRYI